MSNSINRRTFIAQAGSLALTPLALPFFSVSNKQGLANCTFEDEIVLRTPSPTEFYFTIDYIEGVFSRVIYGEIRNYDDIVIVMKDITRRFFSHRTLNRPKLVAIELEESEFEKYWTDTRNKKNDKLLVKALEYPLISSIYSRSLDSYVEYSKQHEQEWIDTRKIKNRFYRKMKCFGVVISSAKFPDNKICRGVVWDSHNKKPLYINGYKNEKRRN